MERRWGGAAGVAPRHCLVLSCQGLSLLFLPGLDLLLASLVPSVGHGRRRSPSLSFGVPREHSQLAWTAAAAGDRCLVPAPSPAAARVQWEGSRVPSMEVQTPGGGRGAGQQSRRPHAACTVSPPQQKHLLLPAPPWGVGGPPFWTGQLIPRCCCSVTSLDTSSHWSYCVQ